MLEAINLTKSYKELTVLDTLNLAIAPGEICCLLGQNGAGKTTTINLFLGFMEPSRGQARVCGKDAFRERTETRKLLAYIPENVMLYPNLTGLENLQYFSALAGFDYHKPQLSSFLEKAGLQGEAYGSRISTYSKGMRQKVGIAIAIAKKAKALLLDEPTSGLDPKASNEFSAILKEQAREGVAILMATHDLFRAKEVGTFIGIMNKGILHKIIMPDEVDHIGLEKLYLETMHV